MTLPNEVLSQHIAVLGKTGSGKTYAAKGLVERMLDDGRQVCVLDPTAAWWGLRLASDGKGRGFDVVLLGGAHADIPLVERSGAAVARLVTQQGASVVIDTSGFTVGEYTRWFIDFAGTLYTTIRNPLHLVIDEAHYFMPQGGGGKTDVDTGKMLHAGNRLMSGGRSLGIRGLMVTQRPAKLHKDSLTCADTLIAMRVIAPQDRAAIKAWIDGAGDPDQGKEVLDSLAQLKRGEGWAWYPEGGYLKRQTFPRIRTYDSSATPTHGAKTGPKVSEIKLDEVRTALAEAVKEAEANDPKLLRKEIADLRKQLSAKPAPAVDQAAIERAVASAVAARDREWERAVKERERIIGDFKGRLSKIHTLAHVNGEAVVKPVPQPVTAVEQKRAPVAATPKSARQKQSSDSGDQLGKCELAILQVLSQHPEGCEIGKLALLAGYRVSGGFRNSLSALRTAGLMVGENTGTMRITDAGKSAGPFEPLPSGQALRDYWLTHRSLGKCERAILAAMLEAPEGLTIDEAASATGYEISGGFRNALSALRTAGVIVGRNTETMRASEELQ